MPPAGVQSYVYFHNRFFILSGIALLLVSVLVLRWISGWGLITVNFDEAPLSKVISAVSRQGGIRIVTNADPSTPVTLHLHRAPLFEALDTLALRIEGDVRLTYLIAPDSARLAEAENGFAGSNRIAGWKVFSAGWGGGMEVGESVPDLRRVSFTLTPGDDLSLHALLDQTSQKTGISFAVPDDWNPVLAAPPKQGTAASAASRMAKAARGKIREIAIISVRPARPAEGERPVRAEGGGEGGGPMGGGGRRGNPEWMAERVQSQIALLPPEERAQAQADFDETRAFFASLRDLPAPERRVKMEEYFERPEVQERIEERMSRRDMKRTPEQRAKRFKRYLDRKAQAQAGGAGPSR